MPLRGYSFLAWMKLWRAVSTARGARGCRQNNAGPCSGAGGAPEAMRERDSHGYETLGEACLGRASCCYDQLRGFSRAAFARGGTRQVPVFRQHLDPGRVYVVRDLSCPEGRLDGGHRRDQPARLGLSRRRPEAVRQPQASEFGLRVVQPDLPLRRGRGSVRGRGVLGRARDRSAPRRPNRGAGARPAAEPGRAEHAEQRGRLRGYRRLAVREPVRAGLEQERRACTRLQPRRH